MDRNFLKMSMAVTLLMALVVVRGHAKADDLPRSGFFGASVAPIGDPARKQAGEAGLEVRAIVPGSAAEAAGFRVGDVLTAVEGTKIEGPAEFVLRMKGRKEGEKVSIAFVREGKPGSVVVEMKARARETNDSYDVIYGMVTSRGKRLRTIMTRPRGPGKHAALFLIQGLGGFSIEKSPVGPGIYADIIDRFTREGYVTFRVDKPGQGDSEGGPTEDVDFDAELDGYRQGLKALAGSPDVDASRILIFGHSMGGVMAPLLAADVPLRGIAAYGTLVKTWHEYMLENTRRQMILEGASASETDEALRKDAVIHLEVFGLGKSPAEVATRHPELISKIDEFYTEGKYYAGRHYRFFTQLASKNLALAWENFPGHALALWGKGDFVSTEADHAMIARIVDQKHPGHGVFLALDGIDHGFKKAGTPEESRKSTGQAGEANPILLKTLLEWANRVSGAK